MKTAIATCVVGLAVAGLAFAQTETNPQPSAPALQDVYRCADIQEDAARLQCYDTAVGRLHQQEQAGQVVALDRTQANQMQREAFGFTLPSLSNLLPRLGTEDVERVEVQVESIAPFAPGRSVFVLSNGQRWAQVESHSIRGIRPGDTVTIRRAALGSYMLLPEHGAGYRVHRED